MRLTGATPLMVLLLLYNLWFTVHISQPVVCGMEVKPYQVNLQHNPAFILELLPGIGPSRAEQIVERRELHLISSPQDLERIHGICQQTVYELWDITKSGSKEK